MFTQAYSWFYGKPVAVLEAHTEDSAEQFEVIEVEDEPEEHAEWIVTANAPELTAAAVVPQLTPAFKAHGKKRRPKLSKAEKKSRRHIRAMWP